MAAWSRLVQPGGLPGGEQHRDSWAGRQNTWQLGLCGQQWVAAPSGFPLLLWILFLGADSQEDPPPSLRPGQESRNAYYGGWGCAYNTCGLLTGLRTPLTGTPAHPPHPSLVFESGRFPQHLLPPTPRFPTWLLNYPPAPCLTASLLEVTTLLGVGAPRGQHRFLIPEGT